MDPLNVARGGW